MAKAPDWTEEELGILRKFYPTEGSSPMLLNLLPNRNKQAVGLKASRIGLVWLNNPRIKRTHEEYLELIKDSTVIPLETYRGGSKPIKHQCKNCSKIWETRPQHWINNPEAKCPDCANKARMTSEVEITTVLQSRGLQLLSTYEGAFHPLNVKHIDCGHEWITKYSYIQQGSGCPVCNKGFGYISNKNSQVSEAHLYLFDIITFPEGDIYSKIGVTVRDPWKRASEIIWELEDNVTLVKPKLIISSSGNLVTQVEHKLLSVLKPPEFKYTGKRFSGFTEVIPNTTTESVLEIMEDLGIQYEYIFDSQYARKQSTHCRLT